MQNGVADEITAWQKLQAAAIGWLGVGLIGIFNRTLRYRTEGEEKLRDLKRRNHSVIYSFWHNQIFCATWYFRHQGIMVITSRHFDGEYIARIIQRFGYRAARGSSSRGAVRALLELKNHVATKRDVAFTVDGPRGPLYKVKPGPVWLSRKTGAPIVPFHIEPRSFWTLGSWDRFRIPKPFTEVLVRFGEPLLVSRKGDEEEWMKRYQDEMDRIRARCESEWVKAR